MFSQTLLPEKIIVVDNFSNDDTVIIINKYFNNLLIIIKLNSNVGSASANNLAVKYCDTEYIALLNPDAYPNKEWLSNLVNCANLYPSAASFGSH